MGLFSSKYVTTVGTSIMRVIEDHSLPNAVKHGAIKGLFEEGNQLIENVMEEVANSIAVKADRMHAYGKREYQYGLPSSTQLHSGMGIKPVQNTIEQLVGQSVTMDYYHFGAFNNLHVGWVKMISDHGYNVKSNQIGSLTAVKGKPVFLSNMVVCVTDASLMEMSNGSLKRWGPPPNAGSEYTGGLMDEARRKINEMKQELNVFELDEDASNDYLRVEFHWFESVNVMTEGVAVTRQEKKTDSFRIEITGYDEYAEWHQARYTRADGEVGYWLYRAGTGTYPAVESLFDTEHSEAGSYFPLAYFRFGMKQGNEDRDGAEYKQGKRLTKYLGLDLDMVADAIKENPDIDKVEQAMLTMAVPAVTENQIEMRYLFDYFCQVLEIYGGENAPANVQNPNSFVGGVMSKAMASTQLNHSIVIQDARFKMALGYRYMYRKIEQGSVAAVGKYATSHGSENMVETGKDTKTGKQVSWSTPVKFHIYQKQVNETQYEEIKVVDLKMTYWVFEQYTTVSDADDEIILIPLDRSITRKYSLPAREELYARSMHYIFNSKVVTEVKWYEQGWFRVVMLIVAIVITILSYGSTWQTVGAALAAGTITVQAVLYMLLIGVLKFLVISLAVRLFVKVVGVKFAFVIALIAAVAGAYQVIQAGGVAGAPMAQEFLAISTSLTKGIGQELKREFAGLQGEADEFKQFTETQDEKLEKAEELLENSNWMTPLVIFGEKPDEYYQRTVHSGNIGVLGFDAISMYVDAALTLPKLTDTL